MNRVLRRPSTVATLAAAFLPLLLAATSAPGSPAPDFRLSSTGGESVGLSSLRGQTVILHFWASWCPHCLSEMPLLEQLGRELAPRGVEVLAINLAEPTRRVTRYVKAHDLHLRVLLDPRGTVAQAYGVVGLPASIVISPEGAVVGSISMGSLDRRTIEDLVFAAAPPRSEGRAP
jgi:peroxiredoxin